MDRMLHGKWTMNSSERIMAVWKNGWIDETLGGGRMGKWMEE